MVFELLQQQVSRHPEAPLHCREITLSFSPDCRQVVLSRYSEHYGPALVRWIERSHTVSVSELFRWLVANGETAVRCHEEPARHAV
ncbi:hypothetical protein N8H74_09025 [Pseudomonas sp. B2M1-30]|uniref:hypothetical protein n=1 Tax=Pseudomonas TaxID=286 RepID=UPI0021C7996A|nr:MULTISPECIES: hypothetical protein [Pseudomonas]MCU0118394.1 hypothetical protein [Pseudomonas sp. B2M1-30]MCU7259568.1 hypothetical protein [Pseudomonas koreensis]